MHVAIVNCFETYEHRVDLLHDYFVSRGDVVRVYTSDFMHFEKRKRTSQKDDFIYLHARPYYKNISPSRMVSHMELATAIFRRLKYQRVDLLWVLIPPNSFAKYAAKMKKLNPYMRLIFDIIDMWPETMPLKKLEKLPVASYWRDLRDRYINMADHVVTECSLYQEKLKDHIAENKMSTIYLARKIEKFKGKPNPPTDKVSLCYLGSMNNILDIDEIGNIIRAFVGNNQNGGYKKVVLHLIGDGEKRQDLIHAAEKAGAEVVYHGTVYDADEKQRIFDVCHYGLNIMKDSVYVGLTMKSMDYFEAGLPIINNIRGDTWDIVEQNHIGINVQGSIKPELPFKYNANQRNRIRQYYEENFGTDTFEKKVRDILQ